MAYVLHMILKKLKIFSFYFIRLYVTCEVLYAFKNVYRVIYELYKVLKSHRTPDILLMTFGRKIGEGSQKGPKGSQVKKSHFKSLPPKYEFCLLKGVPPPRRVWRGGFAKSPLKGGQKNSGAFGAADFFQKTWNPWKFS